MSIHEGLCYLSPHPYGVSAEQRVSTAEEDLRRSRLRLIQCVTLSCTQVAGWLVIAVLVMTHACVHALVCASRVCRRMSTIEATLLSIQSKMYSRRQRSMVPDDTSDAGFGALATSPASPHFQLVDRDAEAGRSPYSAAEQVDRGSL